MRYTSAGMPRHMVMATLCSSPPDRCCTSWSISSSIRMGFITSVMNWGCMYESRMRLCSRLRTVLVNLGLIFWGLYEMLKPGISTKWSSGFSMPASSLMKVVLPVPFSPSITIISESVKAPSSTLSTNLAPPRPSLASVFMVAFMAGYLYSWNFLGPSSTFSDADSATLKVRDSSRNRRFSVGTKPARKMLMPSRTPKGMVTTP
mmetsp:Transcript_9373/g.28173  ORF Transcript_9373/g.28173 Transcript_9373/m.28173 type:complete len:204 (+) Transcript_9373:2587-3198(+)